MKRLICFAMVAALTVASIGCGKANQDFVKEPNIENAQEENIPEQISTLPPTQETIIPTPDNPEPPPTSEITPQPSNPQNWPNNLCGILPDILIHTYVPGNFHYNSSVTNNGTEIIFHSYGPRGGSIHNLNLATGKITIDQYGISQNHLEFMPSEEDYLVHLNSFLRGHQIHQSYSQSNTDILNLQLIIDFIESIILTIG